MALWNYESMIFRKQMPDIHYCRYSITGSLIYIEGRAFEIFRGKRTCHTCQAFWGDPYEFVN